MSSLPVLFSPQLLFQINSWISDNEKQKKEKKAHKFVREEQRKSFNHNTIE